MIEKLTHLGAWLFLELPVVRRSVGSLASQLEKSGRGLCEQYAKLADSEWNRRVLSHVIGIELWGQSRLRVALGEPFVFEEYDGYRPPLDTEWPELLAQFEVTRAETVHLARELAAAGAVQTRIMHNQWGELSVRAWLRYLDIHANWESQRAR
ncbi:MAG: hypothetical protein D6775_14485 [Caldilineae bacterium]|nr:MAG: hypothetical protein D6775_14485 [Caldilineae bacterium]